MKYDRFTSRQPTMASPKRTIASLPRLYDALGIADEYVRMDAVRAIVAEITL